MTRRQWSRRSVLVGGLSTAVLPAALSVAEPAAVRAEVGFTARLAGWESRHGVLVGLQGVDLGSGASVVHRGGDRFAMCSTFKVYAAAAVLRRVAQGQLALTDAQRIEPADLRPNSPVTELRVGATMTVDELCQAALQRSDNAAGNWLLRLIGGPPALTAFARSIGDDQTRLDRWETQLNSAEPGSPLDTSTPAALGGGFRALLTADALPADARERLRRWMTANQTSSMRAGLPAGWVSADKTGAGDYGSTNDVGVLYGPAGQQVVLSLMIRSAGADPGAPSQRALIAEVAAAALAELGHRR